MKILFLDQKILIKMCCDHFSSYFPNQGFSPNMSISSRYLGIFLFLWIRTAVCSGMCNSFNIYPTITYFISFESKVCALQHPSITKFRAEHPFSSSGHILSNILNRSHCEHIEFPQETIVEGLLSTTSVFYRPVSGYACRRTLNTF